MVKPQEIESFRPVTDVQDPTLVRVHLEMKGLGRPLEPCVGLLCIGLGPAQDHQVSSRGESHPPALAEPDVNVSPHPAPITQPAVAGPDASAQTAPAPVLPRPPGTATLAPCARATACISAAPSD